VTPPRPHKKRSPPCSAVLQGAGWPRCCGHCVRNAVVRVPRTAAQRVAATIRTVLVQPDAQASREQWRRVADSLRPRFPRLAALLDEAAANVLAYLAFPPDTGARPGRTTAVMGVFPNAAAGVRLVGRCLLSNSTSGR
jgi:transposase-like protein